MRQKLDLLSVVPRIEMTMERKFHEDHTMIHMRNTTGIGRQGKQRSGSTYMMLKHASHYFSHVLNMMVAKNNTWERINSKYQ